MMGLVPSRREQVSDDDVLGPDDLYKVGVVGYLHKLNKASEGYYQVLVSGTKKIAVSEYVDSKPYMRAKVVEIPMEVVEDKKRGLVARLAREGEVDEAAVKAKLGEFTRPWEWAA